ncbi:MAG: phosphatase PAP2 family protein [Treponema sp.]|nr:phosphatase PAP2 family protein [Treponema sp.]
MKKILIFAILACLAASCFSYDKTDIFGKGDVFQLDPLNDSLILGTGFGIYGTDLILDKGLKIGQPEYKGEKFLLSDLNGLDRKAAQKFSHTIDKVSDVALISSFALPAVLLTTEMDEWDTITVMYAETMLLAQGIKEAIKIGVYRPRPYMYFDGIPEKDVYDDRDWANSFVSGHTTMSFTAATFTTYTFSKYFPDSPWKYVVGAGSYTLAACIAGSRIAAGCHFPTDVIAGAVLGTGIGFLVPWLHTLKVGKDDNTSFAIIPNGVMVSVKL